MVIFPAVLSSGGIRNEGVLAEMQEGNGMPETDNWSGDLSCVMGSNYLSI